jgi:hypothetical protein
MGESVRVRELDVKREVILILSGEGRQTLVTDNSRTGERRDVGQVDTENELEQHHVTRHY